VFFGMPLRPFMPAMIALVFVLEFLNVKGDYYALFEGVDISGWRYWARVAQRPRWSLNFSFL